MSQCVQRDENGEVIINNIFNFIKKETVVKKPPKDNRYSSLCNTPEVEKKVKVQPDSFSVYSHRYTVGNVRF